MGSMVVLLIFLIVVIAAAAAALVLEVGRPFVFMRLSVLGRCQQQSSHRRESEFDPHIDTSAVFR